MKNQYLFIFFLSILLPLHSSHASEVSYDTVYPYYVETTSMTEINRIGAQHGGFAGHAFAYIKGICRDLSAGYPRVKVCEDRKDRAYTPEEEANGIGFN